MILYIMKDKEGDTLLAKKMGDFNSFQYGFTWLSMVKVKFVDEYNQERLDKNRWVWKQDKNIIF